MSEREDAKAKFMRFMEKGAGIVPFVQAFYMRLLWHYMRSSNEWIPINLREMHVALGNYDKYELKRANTILIQMGFIRMKNIDKETIEYKLL